MLSTESVDAIESTDRAEQIDHRDVATRVFY
jgi:hypothetical protein